jgi:hypothetical protein
VRTHSVEGSTAATVAATIENGNDRPGRSTFRGKDRAVAALPSFALAVEPVELVEQRRECIREAQFSLTRWEQTRDPLDRARLLAALMILQAMVRSAS